MSYKLISLSPNDDDTFDMEVQHKETGEFKLLRGCSVESIDIETGGKPRMCASSVHIDFKFEDVGHG